MTIEEISAQAAAERLQSAPDSTVLLDVRETDELRAAAVTGALHMPMAEVPARLDEIDRDKTVICMCHLGGRSAYVAEFLNAQGFPAVLNLAGGIEAWARDVDPDVVR